MNIVSGSRWVASQYSTATVLQSGLSYVLSNGRAVEVESNSPVQLSESDVRSFKRFASKLRGLASELDKKGKAKFDMDGPSIESSSSGLAGLASTVASAVAGGVTAIFGSLKAILFSGIRFVASRMATLLVDAVSFVARTFIRVPYFVPALVIGGAIGLGYLYFKYRKPGSAGVDMDKAWADLSGVLSGPSEERETPAPAKEPSREAPTQSTPAAPRAAEVEVSKTANKSIQFNNPGNLVFASQDGAYRREGSKFAGFNTQAEGLYQLGRQLQLYDGRGINTVRKIASVYAPKHENDTASYIKDVSSWLGVTPDDKLPMDDPEFVASFIAAIVRRENGRVPYTKAQYVEAALRSIAGRSQSVLQKEGTGSVTLVTPTAGRLSSVFGERYHPTEKKKLFHHGIDIAAPSGTDVVASTDGVVTRAGSVNGYGNLIELNDGRIVTKYGHLSSFGVKVGDRVAQGQVIGKVGSTGRSTGPHLHFEVIPLSVGEPVDPGKYLSLPSENQQVASGVGGAPVQVSENQYIWVGSNLVRIKK